jgi:dUTP pyrophosphatase
MGTGIEIRNDKGEIVSYTGVVGNRRKRLVINTEGSGRVNVKIKRLTPDAVTPQYATSGAAGFDIEAYIGDGEGDGAVNGYKDAIIIPPGERRLIGTALAFGIPDGYEMQLRPRSGSALKYGISLTNSPATIDSDFTGEVKVILENRGDIPFVVADGDRIAQGVIAPVVRANFSVVDELSDTERGDCGFGSTGVNG